MPVVLVRVACTLLLAGLSAGCGPDVTRPDTLHGKDVARMAEHELEAENPQLVSGALTCPDLAFRVGAAVRCLRTTTLTNGRVVKVAGTVRVTSLASGGRLHVAMDKEAAEFGVSGAQVAAELRRRYPRLFHGQPGAVSCPYVRGRLGSTATCRVQVGATRRLVDAVVAHVDAATYDVRCSFRSHDQPSAAPS